MPQFLGYHTLIQQLKEPERLRANMVNFYYQNDNNASLAAREFNTKRQTVTKWVKRFAKFGPEGLKDQSRAPQSRPNQLTASQEQEILELKKRMRHAGPNRLKAEGIAHSTSTIYRVLKSHHWIKKHKKRWQKRRMLSAVKRQARALRYWQADVKYLDDIGGLWPFIEQKAIPKYEYTARDVRTGTTFVCYSYHLDELTMARFGKLLLEHLKRWSICMRDVIIQTDNGPENIGSIYAKKDSLLSLVVQDYGATHKTIPVASPRFNSHVESFHGIVEREFYSQEYLPTEPELLAKATSYLWYFNLERKNLEKNKSPFDLIKQQTQILTPSFLNFPPIILDYLPWFGVALRAVPYVTEEVIIAMIYLGAFPPAKLGFDIRKRAFAHLCLHFSC